MDKRPPEVIELSNAKETLRTFLEGIYILRPRLFEQFLDENYTIPQEEKDSVTTGPFTIRYTLKGDETRKVHEETIDPEPVTVAPFIVKLIEKYMHIIPELLNEIRLNRTNPPLNQEKMDRNKLIARLSFLKTKVRSGGLFEQEIIELRFLETNARIIYLQDKMGIDGLNEEEAEELQKLCGEIQIEMDILNIEQ